MAIGPDRVEVEHIRAVIVTTGFILTGYAINPAAITITLMKSVKDKTAGEISISEMQIRSLLSSFGWEITGFQILQDSIITTATKQRTIAKYG